MPRKRDVLEQLKRDELVDAAERLDVPVRDRRVRDDLIEALASSRKAGLAGILEGLSRDRLKEICRALDLDDSGRKKAVIIARLAGQDGHAPARKPAAEVPAPSLPSVKGTDSAVGEGGGSLSRAAGEALEREMEGLLTGILVWLTWIGTKARSTFITSFRGDGVSSKGFRHLYSIQL